MIAPNLACHLVPESPNSRIAKDRLRVRLFHESQISHCESLLADYGKNIAFLKNRLLASQRALAHIAKQEVAI
jgi:hypothetical protein